MGVGCVCVRGQGGGGTVWKEVRMCKSRRGLSRFSRTSTYCSEMN